MKAWDILGWTADAAVYCDDCAEKRYGPAYDDDGEELDRTNHEGNEVHPIFASDECRAEGEYCDDCNCEVVEPCEEEQDEDKEQRA